jgi:hypothetical protein
LRIAVAIFRQKAPGFRNRVVVGKEIGGVLLRNRSNSSAMNLLHHMRVVALGRCLQEVVRSRHAMPIAAKSWTKT